MENKQKVYFAVLVLLLGSNIYFFSQYRWYQRAELFSHELKINRAHFGIMTASQYAGELRDRWDRLTSHEKSSWLSDITRELTVAENALSIIVHFNLESRTEVKSASREANLLGFYAGTLRTTQYVLNEENDAEAKAAVAVIADDLAILANRFNEDEVKQMTSREFYQLFDEIIADLTHEDVVNVFHREP
ncbi:MAG: hypothetical protein SCK29_12545 [Bacillota bacterium]|nr:hypothetical protein [Bacillota bacterium]MDW7684930.1 hypothetical protein [Bacillota bacterium]